MIQHAPWQSERGTALLAVLLVALFLGLLAVGLVATGRTTGLLAGNAAEISRATLLADSAIETGIAQLLDGRVLGLKVDGTSRLLRVADHSIELSIQDELGLLDINAVPEQNLRHFLTSFGLSEMRAASLADAIADWRDVDDLRRLNGAEAPDYEAAGRNYRPRNRRFERVDELRHVLGMDSALFARLEPFLTVHGGGIVDISVAPIEVMRSIPGVDEAAMLAQLSGRRDSEKASAAVARTGRAFRLSARLTWRNGIVVHRVTSIRLTGDGHYPYWVLDWRNFSRAGGL